MLLTEQIQPNSLFLEEDLTQNGEFPVQGKLNLPMTLSDRYKVCGDPMIEVGESSSSSREEQSNRSGWAFSKPWTRQGIHR